MTITNLWKFLKDRTLLCILSATPHLDVKNLSVDTFSSSSIKLYRGHHTTRQHFFHRNVTTTKPRGHIEFLHHFDELVLRTMRLLTHNLLACHAKACATTSNNFPLILKDVQLELIEAEPNEIFIKASSLNLIGQPLSRQRGVWAIRLCQTRDRILPSHWKTRRSSSCYIMYCSR